VAHVVLYAWHKESPEAFETWQKPWKEAQEAASTRKAASEAWQMAKKALHQAKMAHQNVVAACSEAQRVPVFSPELANLSGADVSFWEKIMNDNWEAAEREASYQRDGPQFWTMAEIIEKATNKSLFLEKVLKSWWHVQNQSFVVETSLNVNQDLSIEVANSSQSKVYYGSACEFLSYELLAKDL
jgi:hypothetical protein